MPFIFLKAGFVLRVIGLVRGAGSYIYSNGARMPGDANTHHDEEGRRVCNLCNKIVFNSRGEVEAFIEATEGLLLSWYYESSCRYYHTSTEPRPRAGLYSLRRFIP